MSEARRYHFQQYEKPYESTAALADFIRSVTKDTVLHGDVMDVGCGAGSALHWFEQWGLTAGCTVMGIDSSSTLIDAAQEHNPNARFLRESFLDPLPACDVVTSIQVLSFIEDWRPALREMLNALRPGGWLFVSSLFWTGVDTHTHASDGDKMNAHYNIISREAFDHAAKRWGGEVVRWRPFYASKPLYAPHAQLRSRTWESMTFTGPLYLPWTFVAVRKEPSRCNLHQHNAKCACEGCLRNCV